MNRKELTDKIAQLQGENSKLRKENDILQARITPKPNCKSALCYSCTHFIGVFYDEVFCEKYSGILCKDFNFNRCPAPQGIESFTEVQTEYILNLTKKSQDRND